MATFNIIIPDLSSKKYNCTTEREDLEATNYYLQIIIHSLRILVMLVKMYIIWHITADTALKGFIIL